MLRRAGALVVVASLMLAVAGAPAVGAGQAPRIQGAVAHERASGLSAGAPADSVVTSSMRAGRASRTSGDAATRAPTAASVQQQPSTAQATAILPGAPGVRESNEFASQSDGEYCNWGGCASQSHVSVAAGTQDVVELSDIALRISDRAGHPLVDTSPDWIFLEDPNQFFYGYPDIVWDASHGRWVATEYTSDCSVSHLYVAVSDGADPTGGWKVWEWSDSSFQMYRPVIGTSADKVVVGFMRLPFSTPWSGTCSVNRPPLVSDAQPGALLVLDWPDLLLGSTVPYSILAMPGATAVPAGNAADDISGVVVAYVGGGGVSVGIVAGTNAAIGGPAFTGWSGVVPNLFAIETATWHAGALVVAGTSGSTLSPYEAIAQISLPDGGPPVALQTIDLRGSNPAAQFATAGVAADGTLWVLYQATRSALPSAAVFAAYQLASDPPGSLHPAAQLTGWDWAARPWAIAPDPLDTHSVWQDSVGSSSTWMSELSSAPSLPAGTWSIDNGATTANAFELDLATTPAPSSGAAEVLVSNTSATASGVLASGRLFPAGGRIGWDLTDSTTGGSTTTGSRAVYLQWGDGAGGWSPVETHAISVNAIPGAVYQPLTPNRILDTRTSTGGMYGGLQSRVPRSFAVWYAGGVAPDAIAVTGNLTVTGQTSAGYLTIAPTLSSTSLPSVSTLNFPVGDNRANGVTVALSPTGTLAIEFVGATSTATAQAVFDVSGYFSKSTVVGGAPAETYHPLKQPIRLVDTRTHLGMPGKLQAGYLYFFGVAGDGVPLNASAVTANVTVPSGATALGYVTITSWFPSTIGQLPSTINFPTGDNRANNLTVPLGAYGTLGALYMANVPATTDLVLDITGYFTPDASGSAYVPLTPSRILDTRGPAPIGVAGPIHATSVGQFQVSGRAGVAGDAVAVSGNLTITQQTSVGYITLAPTLTSGSAPAFSTLNAPVGDNRANGVDVGLGSTGALAFVYWAPVGNITQLVFDVGGYFR